MCVCVYVQTFRAAAVGSVKHTAMLLKQTNLFASAALREKKTATIFFGGVGWTRRLGPRTSEKVFAASSQRAMVRGRECESARVSVGSGRASFLHPVVFERAR